MSSTRHDTKAPRAASRGCCLMRLFRPRQRLSDDAVVVELPLRIPLSESTKRAQRKLQLACVCSLIFMCAEVVGGSLAGSLAIMTDAAHLLSDVAGFCISLFAIWMSTLPATKRLSFGFQRAEVIGALTSVMVIWVLTGVLVYAAVGRLQDCLKPHPEEHANGRLMFIVAAVGLVVNLVLMQILGHGDEDGTNSDEVAQTQRHGDTLSDSFDPEDSYSDGLPAYSPADGLYIMQSDQDNWVGGDLEVDILEETPKPKKKLENLNIEAAYIHALGDCIQSMGVCAAGALIWYNPEWQIADPIATFLFSVLVMSTTIGIVRDSIHILMEGTPDGVDVEEIERGLRRCSSVVDVHDLHIWSLSAAQSSLSVHLVSDDTERALHAAQQYLSLKGITHSTIQVEKASSALNTRDCKSHLRCGQVSPSRLD